jgi:hypothetical protein
MKKEIPSSNFKLISETDTEATKSVTYNLMTVNLVISKKSIDNKNFYEFVFTYNKEN